MGLPGGKYLIKIVDIKIEINIWAINNWLYVDELLYLNKF